MKKLKIKTEMLRKKRSSHKAEKSVLRPEWSLWWERFVAITLGIGPHSSCVCESVCQSRRQRNRRTLSANILWRGFQNWMKFGSLIEKAVLYTAVHHRPDWWTLTQKVLLVALVAWHSGMTSYLAGELPCPALDR